MLRKGLERLACEVAISAPLRKGKYNQSAQIPWELIKALRVLLTKQGYDWKAMVKNRIQIENERAQARKQ